MATLNKLLLHLSNQFSQFILLILFHFEGLLLSNQFIIEHIILLQSFLILLLNLFLLLLQLLQLTVPVSTVIRDLFNHQIVDYLLLCNTSTFYYC